MKDYVLVDPNTLHLLLARASTLGFTELVLLTTSTHASWLNEQQQALAQKSKITLLFGLIVEKESQIPKKHSFDILVLLGTSNQGVFPRITHVLNNELTLEKDGLHQRRSGFNHVLAQEYAKKHIGLLFSTTQLAKLPSSQQAQLLGRVKQNMILATKYGLTYEICTLAQTPLELRHAKDLASMKRIL